MANVVTLLSLPFFRSFLDTLSGSSQVISLHYENRPFTSVLPFLPVTTDLPSRSFLSSSCTAPCPRGPVVGGLAGHLAGHPSRPMNQVSFPTSLLDGPVIPLGREQDPRLGREVSNWKVSRLVGLHHHGLGRRAAAGA